MLQKIWKGALFIGVSLGALQVYAIEPAGELNQKTSHAAFPPAKIEKDHAYPDSRQLKILKELRKQYLGLVKLSERPWITALSEGTEARPTAYQRELILDALESTPVWICKGSCSRCSVSRSTGCAASKLIARTTGTAIFLSDCLFEGEQQCRQKGVRSGTQRLADAVEQSLAMVGYYKINSSRNGALAEKGIQRAAKALRNSESQIHSLLASCPGPFPAGADRALRNAGHLKEVSAYFTECSKRLLDPLKTLPAECKDLKLSSEYEKKFTRGVLWEAPLLFRCDGYCQVMTCAPKKNRTPRLLTFGLKTYLSFPEDSCEGDQPRNAAEFYEAELRGYLPPMSLKACVKKLAPFKRSQEKAGPVELPDGPSIDIIEH